MYFKNMLTAFCLVSNTIPPLAEENLNLPDKLVDAPTIVATPEVELDDDFEGESVNQGERICDNISENVFCAHTLGKVPRKDA